jgi:hypothetical protein
MTPVFALEPLKRSIFLAGPTPRDPAVPSWRPQALKMLEQMGFDGDVYVPEQRDWQAHDQYDRQIHWEWEALNQATVVAFWVPRDMATMPALTTNVEFGLLVQSGKLVLGFPEGAPKMKYLARLAERHGAPVHNNLAATLEAAVARCDRPFGG